METKIKEYQTKLSNYAQHLRDVRVVGLLLFLVVLLMMSWSGVKVIETNYSLQKQISQLQQQKDLQELSNTNLKLTNEYYGSNQYLELMARQNFGMAAPGETVLVVPQDVALSHTVDKPNTEQEQQQQAAAKQPFYQRNFQAWMNFFLHRQPQE
ncbi:MAG TPA: septum formation initiator family protein [Candidatus Saccharimonadales bacterium]|nr:septum formation initiator family protein [Candidatus Saccharimonadales bacterium]